MKNLFYALTILLSITAVTTSQTPQYYNYHTGGGFNNWPFNRPNGAAVNYLFIAGEFNQPSPIPPGQSITTVYFKMTAAGTRTFTSLQILMAQDEITNLTGGLFYPGPYDTVYNNTNVTCSNTNNGWMSITLDHGFNYYPAKSLILFVGQCGFSGTGSFVYNFILSGITRTFSVGGCPFIPSGSDNSVLNFGVDVVPVTGITKTNNGVPGKYSLGQNYPNPFNPVTKIKFEIPNSKSGTNPKTEIRIYDILGKEAAVLVNEELNPGTYEVNWDASNYSSGVYYYTLNAGDYSETKKMILAK